MKNISALYGGAVTSNIREFYKFSNDKIFEFESFHQIVLLKQIVIFFILKVLSINLFYRNIFFKIIKYTYIKNFRFLLKLFYPSLKFKIIKFPKYYFTNISYFAQKLIFYQLTDDKSRKENHKKRKINNIHYYKSLYKKNIKQITLLNISDFNYQNFIDFPILVKDRKKLNNFLLDNGIESRLYYYRNCEKIFHRTKKLICKNAERYENEIICLPNSKKITINYIDYIVKTISNFYSKK